MRTLTRFVGVALVLGAILAAQSSSVLSKSLFDRADPLAVVFARYLFSALPLLLIARPRVTGFTKRTWLWLGVLTCSMVAMNVAFILAIERIPVGVVVTLELVGPLTISAVQVRRVRDALWIGLAFVGVALIGAQSFRGELDPVGLLFAAIAGTAWAIYIIASKRVGQRVAGVRGLAISLTIGVVLLAPWCIAHFTQAVRADATVLAPMLGVAVLGGLLTYGLEMMSLRRIPTAVFGVFMSLEPVAASLIAAAFLGETLGIPEIVAIVLVMLASAGVAYTSRAPGGAAQYESVETGSFGVIVPAGQSPGRDGTPAEQFPPDDPEGIDPEDALT